MPVNIYTGMDGPFYQGYSNYVTPFAGPWHQAVHTNTQPSHFHFGHHMYNLFSTPTYGQNSYQPYVPMYGSISHNINLPSFHTVAPSFHGAPAIHVRNRR